VREQVGGIVEERGGARERRIVPPPTAAQRDRGHARPRRRLDVVGRVAEHRAVRRLAPAQSQRRLDDVGIRFRGVGVVSRRLRDQEVADLVGYLVSLKGTRALTP